MINFENNLNFMEKLKQQNEYITNNYEEYVTKTINEIMFLKDKIYQNKDAISYVYDALKHDNLFYNICDNIDCYKYLKFYKIIEIHQSLNPDINYKSEYNISNLQKTLYLFRNLEEFLCYNVNIRNKILDFIHGLEYCYENKFIDNTNFLIYISELENKIRELFGIEKSLNMQFVNGKLCYSDFYGNKKPLIYLIPPTTKYLQFVKNWKNDFQQRFLNI